MADQLEQKPPSPQPSSAASEAEQPSQPACQLCNGRLIDIRGKLQCERCHIIWETCCEGGRW